MDTKQKIQIAQKVLDSMNPTNVKVLKNDRSLLERTMGSSIVLTEDNRELLRD